MAPLNCTPLADLNGRARTTFADQKVTISEGEADAIRRKLIEQRGRATAAEEKVASQDRMIQQLTSALAKEHSQGRKGVDGYGALTGKGRDEKAMELAALQVDLHQARQLLESKDSEIERLLPEVAVSRMQASQRLCNKDAETDRLHRELDWSRTELAQLQPELHQARAELAQLRPELRQAYTELAQLRPELHQARQSLERKEEELDRLLPEIVASRMNGSQRFQTKEAQLDRFQCELSHPRTEHMQHHSKVEGLRNTSFSSGSTRAESEVFDEFAVERKLTERKINLAMQQQALVAREASSPQFGFVQPGSMSMHKFAPVSTAPTPGPKWLDTVVLPKSPCVRSKSPCGGLWDRLDRY